MALGPKRKKRAWEEDSDEGPDSEDEREKQRQEDQREKEEFEQRLRDRDEAKTRKLMEAKLSAEEIEVCLGIPQWTQQGGDRGMFMRSLICSAGRRLEVPWPPAAP